MLSHIYVSINHLWLTNMLFKIYSFTTIFESESKLSKIYILRFVIKIKFPEFLIKLEHHVIFWPSKNLSHLSTSCYHQSKYVLLCNNFIFLLQTVFELKSIFLKQVYLLLLLRLVRFFSSKVSLYWQLMVTASSNVKTAMQEGT